MESLKGYGIDLAAHALIELGVQGGFINAGGDLYCWGTNPEKNPWQIGIKHPRQEGYLGVFALSSLGRRQQVTISAFSFTPASAIIMFLIPKPDIPPKGKQSVTVVGPETSICDALSTALFVSKEPEVILENYPEYGAVIVTTQGEILNHGQILYFPKVESVLKKNESE